MKKFISLTVVFLITLSFIFTSSCIIKKEEISPTESEVLSAPGGVVATQGSYPDKIAVTWNNVSGATKYYIYRSTAPDSGFTKIKSIKSNYYEDINIIADTNYYYKVKAGSDLSISPFSGIVLGYLMIEGALPAPEGVMATDGTYPNEIVVNWDEVTDAENYLVFRSTEDWSFIKVGETISTSYHDTDVTSGELFYYRIKSWRDTVPETSAYSIYDTGFTVFTTPQNIAATRGTDNNQITITWDAVNGADNYYIYRALTSTGTYSDIGYSSNVSYEDSSIDVGATYFYKVKAYAFNFGFSELSTSDYGYLKYEFEFIKSWGGSGPGQFQLSYGAECSGRNIFIVDFVKDCVIKFALDGTFLKTWGVSGTGDGEFDDPIDIAIDSGGNIYITDSGNDRIQKFNVQGNFVLTWGSSGSGNNQFQKPMSIDVDSIDNVYVLDYQDAKIKKYTSQGVYITSWSIETNSKSMAIDGKDNVYVASVNSKLISKYDSNGNFIMSWSVYYPDEIAINKKNNIIFFSDHDLNTIRIYNSTGNYLGEVCSGLTSIYAIGIDSQGNIYAVDSSTDLVYKYGRSE